MQKGTIGVTTENIFPIIKKFLYSDHEIFLRELISNAVDATQKLKTLASHGEYKGNTDDLKIRILINKEEKTLTISDQGIGMTSEELDKYINQIAFSSAGEFLDKYKDNSNAIIGHFGLGFYSSFMVSQKVEINSLSYKPEAKGIKWACEGNPEFTMEESPKDQVGTDITLYLDEENQNFLDESKVEELLNKYCKFLPVEIVFGKEKEWKDGKYVETDKDHTINNTKPLWTKKPVDLKDEDYNTFYRELYPSSFETPLFNIHLNVDYPFNLTGILYFPKIKSNLEIQRNKIQLYSNQVFVTDSVEGIVPEFLTLLHGVIDSPDIPLNVSRSYLQSDPNVKKISSHITKKVADRLQEIFKNNRDDFEKKWDDIKVFIQYGMLTDEKFYERAEKFVLLKNTDKKYFTLEEYQTLIKDNQTDKDNKLIILYASDVNEQYTYIDTAKAKGYDVLLLDGQLDTHFIQHLEQKLKDVQFTRVDADTIDNLIKKEEKEAISLSENDQQDLRTVFESALPSENNYYVSFENMGENASPILITRSEFMRRMKDMSAVGGGAMSFYGDLPDSYNLVVNANHPLVDKVLKQKQRQTSTSLKPLNEELEQAKTRVEDLSNKKEEERSAEENKQLDDANSAVTEIDTKRNEILKEFSSENKIVKQLIDLALLSNNMLTGEALARFVKRSVELIK